LNGSRYIVDSLSLNEFFEQFLSVVPGLLLFKSFVGGLIRMSVFFNENEFTIVTVNETLKSQGLHSFQYSSCFMSDREGIELPWK